MPSREKTVYLVDGNAQIHRAYFAIRGLATSRGLPTGSTLYDRKLVEEKFGVPPERVVDVLALVGDAVDNVPGVPGIGDKGARDLVRQFGTVEEVLANAGDVKRAAYRDGLLNHRDQALLSKSLVTLRFDAPVRFEPEAWGPRPPAPPPP